MCLAYPGKIIEIENDIAIVDYGKEQRKAKILNSKYKIGDYVIVQAQIVVQKLTEKQALDAIRVYDINTS